MIAIRWKMMEVLHNLLLFAYPGGNLQPSLMHFKQV
jgi:hypothetical protein